MKTIRTKQGVVIRVPNASTAVVEITELLSHPKYIKRYKRRKRFHAQVSGVAVQVGQKVTIRESRPHSKLKHWTVKVDSKKV
ncbi:MAG: 30S ribosomal protein S17 [bacterium]|nr:30S ribosomal protein S17 [bacterium]